MTGDALTGPLATMTLKEFEAWIAAGRPPFRDSPAKVSAPEPETCWFCERVVSGAYLIAGYDTFDEQRLACLDCDRTIKALSEKGWFRSAAASSTGDGLREAAERLLAAIDAKDEANVHGWSVALRSALRAALQNTGKPTVDCVGKSDDRWLCAVHEGGYFGGRYSGARCSMAAALQNTGEGLDVARVKQAVANIAKRHGLAKDPPIPLSVARIWGYSAAPADMDAEIAAEYDRLAALQSEPQSEEASRQPKSCGCSVGVEDGKWEAHDEDCGYRLAMEAIMRDGYPA